MYAKIRNVIMCILTAIIIICLLTVTLTFGRFTKEEESGGSLGSDISFTVSNQMEVNTVEELFVAIANGYSYVKVADDMENPLVVSSATVTVGSDLIIDLNGHDLQRNNREAMLNIAPNVRVTVIDSSTAQKGSLYNPVGSVLQIGGGTLTISAGKFESGPRAEEYDTYTASEGQYPTHGSISTTKKLSTKLHTKGEKDYSESATAYDLPIITPIVTESDIGKTDTGTQSKTYYYANGNMYIDDDSFSSTFGDLFGKDTYLYYSIADSVVESNGLYSSGSADFYYSYYTDKKTDANGKPSYSGAYTESAKDRVAVTVYGYNNVIAAAKNQGGGFSSDNRSDFAAIKMQDGDLQVCGGTYVSNFGVKSAYCVYASGGDMVVDDGTFYAVKEGVCVSCNYPDTNDSLRVTRGNFESYRGDTIQMTAGTMTITGGTFVKDSTNYTEKDEAGNKVTAANHNNAAINIQKGTITLESTATTPINFYLAGYYMAAIRCSTGAHITSTGVNYQFGTTNGTNKISGGNNIGIYSGGSLDTGTNTGGSVSGGTDNSGSVIVRGCKFIQPGDYSYGIYSSNEDLAGTALVEASSSIFSLGGKRCVGIYANGGTINIGREEDMTSQATIPVADANTKEGYPIETYTMFYLDHVANCYGVYVSDTPNVADTSGGTATTDTTGGTARTATKINVYAGQFVIGSGIGADGKTPYGVSELPKDPTVSTVNDNDKAWVNGNAYSTQQLIDNEEVWSAGVYLNQTGAHVGLGRVRMIIGGDYSAGIFVASGEVDNLYPAKPAGQTESEIVAPTTVLFVGTTLRGYVNGGYDELTPNDGIDWAYLYKRDLDYVQNENFMSYYDRIVNCDSHYEYGVAAKGGDVDIGRIYINLRSMSSRGIFASGGDATVDELIGDIDNQVWTTSTGTDGKTVFTGTAPETLTTTTMTIRNGDVTINDADIHTSGIGILLNLGKLTFNGNVTMQSIHSSPIYITSTAMTANASSKAGEGSTGTTNTWTISANSKVNITCTITAGKPYDVAAQKFKYEVDPTKYKEEEIDPTEPIPWVLNRSNSAVLSYNGVNIKGGSLIGDGELVVEFTGLENKGQNTYDPYNMSLSSSAINVERIAGYADPVVKLWHAHVKSNAGGGISVKGGDVTLGAESLTNAQKVILNNDRHNSDKNNLIEIETLGNTRHTNLLGSYTNWNYYPSKTGGPGIKVSDGSINVYYGTYSALQGNGILVSNGEATVFDGVFKGDNTGWDGDVNSNGSGVASYYGFMLRGGGKLTINDGTFEGFNGGAFVTGGNTVEAVANVYGGTYDAIASSTTRTTNGFSVGYNATVTIGKANPEKSYVAPSIKGFACGIAIENNGGLDLDTVNYEGIVSKVSVTVQGGTVVKGERNDNGNAIWQGNTKATLSLGECTLWIKYSHNAIISGNSKSWKDITALNVYAIKTDVPAESEYSAITLTDSCGTTQRNDYRITAKSLNDVNKELSSSSS